MRLPENVTLPSVRLPEIRTQRLPTISTDRLIQQGRDFFKGNDDSLDKLKNYDPVRTYDYVTSGGAGRDATDFFGGNDESLESLRKYDPGKGFDYVTSGRASEDVTDFFSENGDSLDGLEKYDPAQSYDYVTSGKAGRDTKEFFASNDVSLDPLQKYDPGKAYDYITSGQAGEDATDFFAGNDDSLEPLERYDPGKGYNNWISGNAGREIGETGQQIADATEFFADGDPYEDVTGRPFDEDLNKVFNRDNEITVGKGAATAGKIAIAVAQGMLIGMANGGGPGRSDPCAAENGFNEDCIGTGEDGELEPEEDPFFGGEIADSQPTEPDSRNGIETTITDFDIYSEIGGEFEGGTDTYPPVSKDKGFGVKSTMEVEVQNDTAAQQMRTDINKYNAVKLETKVVIGTAGAVRLPPGYASAAGAGIASVAGTQSINGISQSADIAAGDKFVVTTEMKYDATTDKTTETTTVTQYRNGKVYGQKTNKSITTGTPEGFGTTYGP